MTILFSMPVHESNPAVWDTISNARRYNPGALFSIHVSAGFSDFDDSIGKEPDIVINPIRFNTIHARTSHVPIHLTNFKHALDRGMSFDRVCVLHTSEMFVKPGLYEHIRNYVYSLWFTEVDQPRTSVWPPFWVSYRHRIFGNLFDGNDMRNYLGNLLEGHWWSRDLFQAMYDWSDKAYGISNMLWPYAAEECYFPTLSRHLAKNQTFTHPYCCFHHTSHYIDNFKDVDDIRANKTDIVFWQPNNFVYNKKPFPGRHLYSIKRISRDMDDPVRRYINSLPVNA